jgi:Tol biopolymer transport system component
MVTRLAVGGALLTLALLAQVASGGGSGSPTVAGPASPPVLAFAARPPTSPLAQLFLLRQDGTVSQLTHSDQSITVESWSPDGRTLLALSSGSRGQLLVDVSVASGRITPLWRGGAVGAAGWSPDGSQIAVGWDGKLSILDARGNLLRTLDEPVVRRTASDTPEFAWSPDGGQLAVAYRTPTGSSVAVERPLGPAPLTIGPCGTTAPCQNLSQPSWAAGSNALVFVRRHGGRSALWWWTGGAPARFPAAGLPDDVSAPAWAPDGHRLAVATGRGLFLVESPSAPAHRLAATAVTTGPVWSADGSQIAFATRTTAGAPPVLSVTHVATATTVRYPDFSTRYQDLVGPLAWRP